MKHIALFSVTYEPFIGGVEIAIKEVTERLPGFEFDIFTAKLDKRLPSQERVGVVNVYRLGTGHKSLDKWFYPVRAARLAVKLHQKQPYDIIHAVLETYAGLAALFFKRRFPRLPYVLTMQSGDSDWFIWLRTWFWRPLYKQTFTRANRITAISNFLAQRANKYGYRGEVKIIPNGVAVANFAVKIERGDKEFIRKSWGLRKTDFVIVTASRLVYKNGIDILIESLLYLPADVKLVIAGAGEEEEKLKEKVISNKEKIGSRVVFLGHIDHNSLSRILKAADAFARPSRSEGLGNAFLEAMAAGLPVIGTPVGGIVDFIKDGATGLLAEVENAKSVAEKIEKLRTDTALRQKLIKAGQRLVRAQYDWEIIAREYQKVYGETGA